MRRAVHLLVPRLLVVPRRIRLVNILPARVALVFFVSFVVPAFKARLAVEREEHEAERVQPAHEDARQRQQISEMRPRRLRQVQRLDDRILGEEPGEGRDARVGERPDEHRRVRDGHVAPQPAHPAHVLLVV